MVSILVFIAIFLVLYLYSSVYKRKYRAAEKGRVSVLKLYESMGLLLSRSVEKWTTIINAIDNNEQYIDNTQRKTIIKIYTPGRIVTYTNNYKINELLTYFHEHKIIMSVGDDDIYEINLEYL